MKSIRCWDDLSNYGIIPLTGEACGLSYRLLCDVTIRGKKTLEKALGLADLGLQENWNQGSAENQHIGSIMLAPELLSFIGVFALLENGCREVWLLKGAEVIGLEADDPPDRVEFWKHHRAADLLRRFGYMGTAGDRNQHVMTGRIV
jgi:hypothetical protein